MSRILIAPWPLDNVNATQCNGFSAGVDPDSFRGPGFQTGYDPVWVDLLTKHADQPFHLLIGGGDQLYCDGCVLILRSLYVSGDQNRVVSESPGNPNYRDG